MNLSTSSSKRIFSMIVLSIVVGMAASMAIVRLIVDANVSSGETALGRVMEAKASLPVIMEEENDLVMFFGSSKVLAGFSPRQFDNELAGHDIRTKSFNFGFGGLNPLLQEYLSSRVQESFLNSDRRLKLAMIEFNPFQTTTTRRNGAREVEDSFITLLASQAELVDIAVSDPERGIRLLGIRNFRNSISAEMITSKLARRLQSFDQDMSLSDDDIIGSPRFILHEELAIRFEQDYPDHEDDRWSYEWQGGVTIPSERSAETVEMYIEYDALGRTPERMQQDLQGRIDSADIIDLNFSPELVDAFIGVVRNLQEISDNVEVVLLPKNEKWIKNPPEAIARLDRVLDRISRETGVTIRSFQDIKQVTPEMFADTTHLQHYTGAVVFTSALVDAYVELLRD